MYGQNLSVRLGAHGEPIFTKFCMPVRVQDVFLSFEFQKDQKKNVGAEGVEISPPSLKRHISYTTACCYRTSRDQSINIIVLCHQKKATSIALQHGNGILSQVLHCDQIITVFWTTFFLKRSVQLQYKNFLLVLEMYYVIVLGV